MNNNQNSPTEKPLRQLIETPSIVIAEDNLPVLKALTRSFNSKFKVVNEFSDSNLAQQFINQIQKPTIVISDFHMPPNINGGNLAEQTFPHRQKLNIPFILQSGGEFTESEEQYIQQLLNQKIIDRLLIKPSPELIKIITETAHKINSSQII